MNTIFDIIVTCIIALSIMALFIAITADFILYDKQNSIKKKKKSIVATGTMTMYYFLYYIIIKAKLGHITIPNELLYKLFAAIGALMVLSGTVINILGRIKLQSNWANHIKIYDNHSMVTTGVYSLVRHPLYSSIMLMLFGGSMAYMNYVSAILTLIIFIPFMYYRAKQEEILLEQEFKDYAEYEKRTGMFFPKILRR